MMPPVVGSENHAAIEAATVGPTPMTSVNRSGASAAERRRNASTRASQPSRPPIGSSSRAGTSRSSQ